MVKNGKTNRKYHKRTKTQHHSSPPPPQENKLITVKTLPAHLLLKILYRTPLKSLVRCRCLFKSWFALIHHPTFIKMHLDFNTSRKDKDKQLICSCGYGTSIDIALLSLSQDPILVLHIDRDFTERPNYLRKINFRDALTNDYKITWIVPEPRFEGYGWSRIEVYSTNQGSWEDVDKKGVIHFRANANLHHCNFIVNGVPYWAGVDVRPAYVDVLGRIDPFTGLFKRIEHPKHVRNKSTRVNPVKLRDSVAALIQSPGEYPNHMIDFYLLDDITAKWTKICSFGPLVFGQVFEQMQIP